MTEKEILECISDTVSQPEKDEQSSKYITFQQHEQSQAEDIDNSKTFTE